VISLEGTGYSSNLRGPRTLPLMIEDLMFFESDQITSQLSCARAMVYRLEHARHGCIGDR
jgi:hypothetical protein